MKHVIIESPYAGNVELHTKYARAALRDSLARGEAPFASHLLYTQVLYDMDPVQRTHSLEAGFAWHLRADLIAVYADMGVSPGMVEGMCQSVRPLEVRRISVPGVTPQGLPVGLCIECASGGYHRHGPECDRECACRGIGAVTEPLREGDLAECDWGHCSRESVAMRMGDDESEWLAVCAWHAGWEDHPVMPPRD